MRLRFQIMLFTAARMVLNTGTRMVYPFLAVFARGMGVDMGAISLALTVRASTGFISPLLSMLADRWGRKTGMMLGLGVYVLSCVLVMFWPVYPVFFVALSLGFMGMYFYMSSVQAYLGDRVPYRQRGMALGLTETGWSLSFIAGMPLVAFLIGRFGWKSTFPVLAGLGLLLLMLFYRVVPAYRPPGNAAAGQSFWHSFGVILRSPLALIGLLMSFATVTANEVVNLVFGVWMEESFGLRIAALGAAAAVIGFAELGGELLSSSITDRLGKSRVVVIGLLLNVLVTLLFPWLGHTLTGTMAGLFLFYFSFEFAIIGEFTLMTEVLPGARATLMGANVAVISLARMLGAMLGPLLYANTGFQANALGALAFNLLALLALSRLHIQPQAQSAEA